MLSRTKPIFSVRESVLHLHFFELFEPLIVLDLIYAVGLFLGQYAAYGIPFHFHNPLHFSSLPFHFYRIAERPSPPHLISDLSITELASPQLISLSLSLSVTNSG
ncbi:unnamed protein product [Malus baccata var. baccata]